MPNLPSASVTINEAAGGFSGVSNCLVVMSCVAQNADMVPRFFTSSKGILDTYLYSQGADYAGLHFDQAKTPILFIGLPCATAGAVGRQNATGVTGSSAITIAAATTGIMEECDASITVVNGGTVGTDGITFDLSLDGGSTKKRIRLGTASSYTVPYVGLVINFGAGTLNAGDVYTFSTTAPMWDSTGLTTARNNLAAQLKQARSWLVIGDLQNSTFAGYVAAQVDAYETANKRFVYARAQLRDRLPLASNSKLVVSMTGNPALTFAASGHTITRASGSFVTDGFQIGDVVTVAGSSSNNGAIGALTGVSATVLTFASGVVNEGPVSGITLTASEGLTFASGGETVTRTRGSWLADGFRVGDSVTITGTASNNVTETITALSATVMTFGAGLANEGPVRSDGVTMTKGQTKAQWVSDLSSSFATIDGEKRLDLGAGRARVVSEIHQWNFRRPVQWAASIREYQHDVQIPCWRKEDGPTGFDMTDGQGNVLEYDDRTDGGLLASRFTCFRTWANGPAGAFISMSVTRDTDGAVLSRTHNLAVANVAQTTIQTESENAIGQVLVLNPDGTGTDASLSLIEQRVNTKLQSNLLENGKEGQRASLAVWSASRTDNLSQVGATLTGSCDLELDGTLEQIATTLRVR